MTTIRRALDAALPYVAVAVFAAVLFSAWLLFALLFNLVTFGDPFTIAFLELL